MMRSETSGLAPHVLLGRDGTKETFIAEQIGFCSSETEDKDRWFEVGIYRDVDGGYIVHTVGRSRIPGEQPYARIVTTRSAFDIIEILTVTHHNRKPVPAYIPRPSMRAIAQAAQFDDAIREAYIQAA